MEKSNSKTKMEHPGPDPRAEANVGIHDEINQEIALIKSRFTCFDHEKCTWICKRRAAKDAVSIRAFRRRLCGSLTSRRARRTVTRIISDPSIMNHTYIPEPED